MSALHDPAFIAAERAYLEPPLPGPECPECDWPVGDCRCFEWDETDRREWVYDGRENELREREMGL